MIQVILVGCHHAHFGTCTKMCVDTTHEIWEHLFLGGFATNNFIKSDINLPCSRSIENDASFQETWLQLP